MVVVVRESGSGGSFIRFIPSGWYSMVLVMQLPKRFSETFPVCMLWIQTAANDFQPVDDQRTWDVRDLANTWAEITMDSVAWSMSVLEWPRFQAVLSLPGVAGPNYTVFFPDFAQGPRVCNIL
jgi:hypothetical protein